MRWADFPGPRYVSSIHSRFGLKYVVADVWAYKCWSTWQARECCLAAIQRVDELQQNLALLGVPAHVGPVKEGSYQLQRLLGSDEQRSIFAANASADVSDEQCAPWKPQLPVSLS